jgi:hypothetical protein
LETKGTSKDTVQGKERVMEVTYSP